MGQFIPKYSFQLYTDPSRKATAQIHPDIPASDPPAYGYGQPVQVGSDEDDPATWPHYVVANISRLRQELNPDQSGESRVVYEVYLERQEEWANFGEPEEFERIRNGTPL